MGSVHHHQTQARRFLSLARSDHNSGKYDRAANALARAASHAATSALFHCALLRRPTRRKLTNTLFMLADAGQISNGGVRIFRSIYRLPDQLATADTRQRQRLSRRARNRVAALIRRWREPSPAVPHRDAAAATVRPADPRPPAYRRSSPCRITRTSRRRTTWWARRCPVDRTPTVSTPVARRRRSVPAIRCRCPCAMTATPSSCRPCGSAPWSAPSAFPSPTPSPSAWPIREPHGGPPSDVPTPTV